MKKRIKFLLTIFLVIIMFLSLNLSLAACADDSNSFNGKLSANMFKGYKVDFSNAAAIGISSGKSNSKTNVSASAQDSLTEGSKNKLITIDALNAAKEVVFQQNSGDNEIKQDDINAEIDKVYATDTFVYFSLTTNTIVRNWSDVNYDQKFYQNNDNEQSFVIDRATGKIYSLSEIGAYISFIEENILSIRYLDGTHTFYQLSIEGENAVFTDIVPNKNIYVYKVFIDKNGTVFVVNNKTDEFVGNVVYCKVAEHSIRYGIGTDGNAYNVVDTEIRVFDNGWEKVDYASLAVDCSTLADVNSFDGQPNKGYCWIVIKNGITTTVGSFYYCQDGFTSMVLGTNIFNLSNGNITMNFEKSVAVPDGISINSFNGLLNSKIYATAETAAGTRQYWIYMDNSGLPKCELVSFAEYSANIIVLQPLN